MTNLKSDLGNQKPLWCHLWNADHALLASMPLPHLRTTLFKIFIFRTHLVLSKVEVLLEWLTNSHKVLMT